MLGTVIGIFIPTVLQNGFIVKNVQPFWQQVAIGFILIAAVYLDQLKRRARDTSLTARPNRTCATPASPTSKEPHDSARRRPMPLAATVAGLTPLTACGVLLQPRSRRRSGAVQRRLGRLQRRRERRVQRRRRGAGLVRGVGVRRLGGEASARSSTSRA